MPFGTAFFAPMPFVRRPGAGVPTFSPKPKMHECGFCWEFLPRWLHVSVVGRARRNPSRQSPTRESVPLWELALPIVLLWKPTCRRTALRSFARRRAPTQVDQRSSQEPCQIKSEAGCVSDQAQRRGAAQPRNAGPGVTYERPGSAAVAQCPASFWCPKAST